MGEAAAVSSGVGDGVGEAFFCFGVAVGVAFVAERFRCLRLGVGVGAVSKAFLIFVPNDCSAALEAQTALNRIARIRSHFTDWRVPQDIS